MNKAEIVVYLLAWIVWWVNAGVVGAWAGKLAGEWLVRCWLKA
jgi:hypothetical protein